MAIERYFLHSKISSVVKFLSFSLEFPLKKPLGNQIAIAPKDRLMKNAGIRISPHSFTKKNTIIKKQLRAIKKRPKAVTKKTWKPLRKVSLLNEIADHIKNINARANVRI